jgi:hypothetical protein
MNCKPGDLAYVINSGFSENDFRFVTVIELSGTKRSNGSPHWIVEAASLMRTKDGVLVTVGRVSDCNLRPIRDRPGDESFIKKAPAPGKKVPA